MSQTSAAQALADLQAEQVAIGTSIGNAIALIQQLQSNPAGVDPAAVEAVVTALKGSQASLDAADAPPASSPAPAAKKV